MSEPLPLALENAIVSGECVLFLGAGIGQHARDSVGAPAPDSATLAADLATHFAIDAGDQVHDLAKVAQVVELRRGRADLDAFLAKRLATLEPDEHLKWLLSLPWKAVFTTNYDQVIERAYASLTRPSQLPVVISSTSDLVEYDPRLNVPIYHLHGALFGVPTPRILITETDYSLFQARRRMLFDVLQQTFAKSNILYIGYSHRDPNWKTLIEELRAEFYPSTPPQSYRVVPATSPLDREILRAQGVTTLDLDLVSFRAAAEVALKSAKFDAEGLKKYRGIVPADLGAAFDANPAATIRLLGSWDYLNQASLGATANFKAFLAGDAPNWALIAQTMYFERDLETAVLEELLDFATSQNPGRPSHIVLGAAGNGVSTALMSLAFHLVRERAGAVFFHRTGRGLNESDVEFAASIFDGPIFFVIDNAADYSDELGDAQVRLRDAKRTACFLLGERLNEWRQRRSRVRPQEYLLEYLSDSEIARVLDLLEVHGALGALRDLEPAMRVAAFKTKHEKQLLVALRELTEGKAFDAIIEDEYRALSDDTSRRLYGVVCAGYHLRQPVRDQLAASVLGLDLTDMYEATRASTEGVIQYDEWNETRGLYAARARHQVIAEIVWERCVPQGDRDDFVLRLVENLNIAFGIDARLFEALVRDDRQLTSMATMDAKMRFFEAACRKAPLDPYVRQHYARMLLREGKLEVALGEIDRAITIAPKARVLHHTRGLVLMELSLSAAGREIARRRFTQAEGAFRQAKSLGRNDAYAYQGLAQLYLGWAKRSDSREEAADYASRAEEVIEEGLRESRDRESLWIASSELQEWIGDEPGMLDALRKAVASTPASTVGRYLLGRALMNSGRAKEAIDVLRPAIEINPNDYRSAEVCARAMVEVGETHKRAIAVLRLSSLYGMRDPRFVSTLGGMLALDGQAGEAEKVFADSAARDTFSLSELERGTYRPTLPGKPGTPIRLEGEVSFVRPSYAFVQVPGLGSFFCKGSRFGGLVMKRGLRVAFSAAFTAKGPVAEGVVGR